MWFQELDIGIIVFEVVLHLYLLIKNEDIKQDEKHSIKSEIKSSREK
jgi:hypothetical protein